MYQIDYQIQRISEISKELKQLQVITDLNVFFKLSFELIEHYQDIGKDSFRKNDYQKCYEFVKMSNVFVDDVLLYKEKILEDSKDRFPANKGISESDFKDIEFIRIENEAFVCLTYGILKVRSRNYSEAIESFNKSISLFEEVYNSNSEAIYLIYSKMSIANQLLAEGFYESFKENYSNSNTCFEKGIEQYNSLKNKHLNELLEKDLELEDYNFYIEMFQNIILEYQMEILKNQAEMNLKNKKLDITINKYDELLVISEKLMKNIPCDASNDIKLRIEADHFANKAQFHYYNGLNFRKELNWNSAIEEFNESIEGYKISKNKYFESKHLEFDSIRDLINNRVSYIEIEIDECNSNLKQESLISNKQDENEKLKLEKDYLLKGVVDLFKNHEIDKWKNQGRIKLIISLVIILFIYFGFEETDFSFNFISILFGWVDSLTGDSKKAFARYILTLLIAVGVLPLLKSFFNSHFSKKRYEEKFNSIVIPDSIFQNITDQSQ
jgi:hypothetical protein